MRAQTGLEWVMDQVGLQVQAMQQRIDELERQLEQQPTPESNGEAPVRDYAATRED